MSTLYKTSAEIIDALNALYDEALDALSASLARFLKDRTPPDGEARAAGAFCYPELVIRYEPDGPPPPICLLYTSPSPRDQRGSRMPSSA